MAERNIRITRIANQRSELFSGPKLLWLVFFSERVLRD
jgi:hypothetical protein